MSGENQALNVVNCKHFFNFNKLNLERSENLRKNQIQTLFLYCPSQDKVIMSTKLLIARECGPEGQDSLQGLIVYFKKLNEDEQIQHHEKAGHFELVKMDRLIWGQYLCTFKLQLNLLEQTNQHQVR